MTLECSDFRLKNNGLSVYARRLSPFSITKSSGVAKAREGSHRVGEGCVPLPRRQRNHRAGEGCSQSEGPKPPSGGRDVFLLPQLGSIAKIRVSTRHYLHIKCHY